MTNTTFGLRIDSCYLARIFYPSGYEERKCKGLRVGKGEGKLIDDCKECAIYYGNREK